MSNASVESTLAANSNIAANGVANATAVSGRRWPAVAALALGAVVIFGVGFTSGIAHNAAHDTRHAMTFPCH